MTHRGGNAVLAAAALLVLAPGLARAHDEVTSGLLSRLHYCITGGILSGVGPQGRTLARGPSIAVNIHGESAIGMQLGVEATYAGSNDILNTRFTSIGMIARLSPTPEDYRAYVQVGAGVYHVTFKPDQPSLETPEDSTRPGGSFGIGLELIQSSKFKLGGIATYSGVVLARSDARSYLVAGLTLTIMPSQY